MRLLIPALLLFTTQMPMVTASDRVAYCLKSTYCNNGICYWQTGSCVPVSQHGGHAWFITAGHVFGKNARVQLFNHWYEVVAIKGWKAPGPIPDSILLFRTAEPVPRIKLRIFPITQRGPPQENEQVHFAGFPKGKYWVKGNGRIIRSERSQILVDEVFRHGSSGGIAVYKSDLSLAGIISGFITNKPAGNSFGILIRADHIGDKLLQHYPELVPQLATKKPEPPKPPVKDEYEKREPLPKAKEPAYIPSKGEIDEYQKRIKELEDQLNQEKNKDKASVTPPPVAPAAPPSESTTPGWWESLTSKIPWKTILTYGLGALGIAVPGGLAGWAILKGLGLLFKKRGGGGRVPKGFSRDQTEAQQILDLRQYEQREPISDALRGVFLEDEVASNPDQSLKDAYNKINERFNNACPVATQHTVVPSG